MKRAAALVLAMLAAGLFLASCGSGGSSTTTPVGSDPATVVPEGSVIYSDVTVRPQGDQKTEIDSALSKLLGRDDFSSLLIDPLDAKLQKAGLSYAEDIEPWLGDKLAIFVPSLKGITTNAGAQGALVIATTDAGAAEDTIRKAAENDPKAGPLHNDTYRGVDLFTQDANAYAVVGDFLVIGSQAAVKGSIDASQTSSSLADDEHFQAAIATAPDDRVATGFIDGGRLVDAMVRSSSLDAGSAGVAKSLVNRLSGPIAMWVDATDSSIGLEISTPAAKPTTSDSLITGFPADSWLAFGAHGVGEGLVQGLKTLDSLPASALGGKSPAAALLRVRRLTGLDLPSFAKWLGDVSGYVAGSSVFSINGAVVLSSHDESAAADTLDEIERILRHDVDLIVRPLPAGKTGFTVRPQSAPVQITVEQQGDKVVAGLGTNPADQALSPSSTLGDSSAFKSATDALGSQLTPSFYLDFGPIGAFLTLPGAANDPQIEQAKPYLDRLDYVVAGSGTVDGRQLSRIVLGVKDGSGSSGDVTAAIPAP